MSAILRIYEDSDCLEETLIRYENTVGSPITIAIVIAMPDQGAGNAPPDELTLDFSYDTGNSQWDCEVTRKDGSDYHVDGITTNGNNWNNIIPGVAVDIGTLDTGQTYQAIVYIGWNPGIIVGGMTSGNKRFWAKNVGNAAGYDARIRIQPDGDFENVTNVPIRAINEEKYLQTTAIGTYNILVKADTSKVDVTFESQDPVEKTIVADGSTENELATGLWVVFNTGLSENDEANIDISDGKNRVQIAEDNDGTPGTFGGSDVVFGAMDIGDDDSFWVKIVTQVTDSPTGNPRHANLQARITTI
ncbi:MAG: hypothetical protein ABIC40_05230 [bacterium]